MCERYNTHVELVTCISVQYLGYDYDKGEPEEVTDALVLENLWRQNYCSSCEQQSCHNPEEAHG